MRQVRENSRAFLPVLVLHDAAILLAVFYAPIFWGGFNSSGLTMVATLVSVAALCAVVWRWGTLNRGPAVIPNAVHLPALAVLLITLVTSWFSASHHASYLELTRIATGVMLLLLVANRALMPAAPALPVAVVFGSSLLVLPFVHASGETGAWLDASTGLAVVCVGAFLLARRDAPDPVRRWVEALVLSAGLAVALYGIREKVFARYFLDNPTWQVFSTFFNPNELAGFLALVIPVGVAVAFSPQKTWTRLIAGFAALLLAVALLPTNSTGAYLAAFAALAWMALSLALTSPRARRNLVFLLLAGLLLAVAVAVAMKATPGAWSKVLGAFDVQRASNMFRILTWKGTLEMALHHPWVGIGPAAFKSAYMNYAVVGYTEAAHQNYLQVFAEQGVFGAVAFLWLLGAILFTGWRALRRPEGDLSGRLLAAGGMGGVIALMVHSLFDYGWYIGATNLTLWFVAGVLAHLSHGRELAARAAPVTEDPPKGRRRRAAEPPPAAPVPVGPVHELPWPRGPVWRALLALCLAGFLCFRIWIAGRNTLAQAAANRADAAMAEAIAAKQQGNIPLARQRYQESLLLYQAAADADPTWSAIHEKLGLSLEGEESEQHLKQAVALEPRSFAPRLSLARFYDQKQRYPEAVRAYQDSLQRFPQHTRALRLLAETYPKMGEEEKSLAAYRQLADLDDEPVNRYRAVDIDVDVNFAYAYYELGRAELRAQPEAALTWLDKCVAVVDEYFKPGGGSALDEMFAQAGKPRVNRAEEMLPLKAKALWRMAEIQDRQGQRDLAVATRSRAVEAFSSVGQLIAEEDRGGAE